MRMILPFLPLLLVGCANVTTSKLIYTNQDGSSISIEIPKEVEAKNLKVAFDGKNQTAEITSESWVSKNQGTIEAQSERESQILEKTIEGAVKGAMKGAVP